MNTFRGLLIYAALVALTGGTATFARTLATGAFHPPIWAAVVAYIAIAVACDPIATALERRTGRSGQARRRAHARTTPTNTGKDGATP